MLIQPLMKLPDVCTALGIGRTALYAAVNEGRIPRPVKPTGSRMSAWPASEIGQLQKAVIAGRSAPEICALVATLHEARTAGDEL